MEYFKNKAESFFREIRFIEIYNAADISYMDNFSGVFPVLQEPLYKIDIVPETFSRSLKTKKKDGNYFYDVDFGFPLLDLSKSDECYEQFNKEGFAVVLTSNTEKLMLGNDRELLTIEFIDNKKDDNSGNDDCNFSITGQTIIPPKVANL